MHSASFYVLLQIYIYLVIYYQQLLERRCFRQPLSKGTTEW